MSEEKEAPESGVAGPGWPGIGVDPAAVALALNAANSDPGVAEDARAYLRKQTAFLDNQSALIADQRHHLHEQLQQLHLNIWEKWFGVLLRVAMAVVGMAVAVGIAFLVWDAGHSKGLLIEPFSVPPELAARGMTGEVIAAKLLDQLSTIEAQNLGQRPPATFANNWEQRDLKLEIPETGVSLSELDRFLRQKLGGDTHVTGEIVRTPSGLGLTVRAGTYGVDSVSGPETELDALVKQLGEAVYGRTQPYRYGFYLYTHGRAAEAVAIYKAMAKSGPANGRAWGYTGWSNLLIDNDTLEVRLRLLERSVSLDPENILTWSSIGIVDYTKSLPEQTARDYKKLLSLSSDSGQQAIRAELIPTVRKRYQGQIALTVGDFREATLLYSDIVESGGLPGISGVSAPLAEAQTGEHDLTAARATMADPDSGNGIAPGNAALFNIRARMAIAAEAEDWAGVLSQAKAIEPLLPTYPGLQFYLATTTTPLIAYAEAKLGNLSSAETRIAATPADCYLCLRMRAHIAELKNDHARADLWFARAVEAAPSIPMAHTDWGKTLLERGDAAGAIAKFTIAHQKGPHFADPLELWGEALMAKNQSHLALAKFAEAEKYAPKWGRLHLKWGAALVYAGKKNEAKKHFARAAQLDLTSAEESELTRMRTDV
jgi:tetratricopeptide (TPR) repeat protein